MTLLYVHKRLFIKMHGRNLRRGGHGYDKDWNVVHFEALLGAPVLLDYFVGRIGRDCSVGPLVLPNSGSKGCVQRYGDRRIQGIGGQPVDTLEPRGHVCRRVY